jgi:predicted amidophosphoribosyltransferase
VTTVEPEWDGPERRAAMALLVFESGLCPGCRQPLAETTRPEREFAYKAGQAIRCHRCTAMEQAHAKYENAPAPGALLIPIVTSGG